MATSYLDDLAPTLAGVVKPRGVRKSGVAWELGVRSGLGFGALTPFFHVEAA
jgi:hypothetical protein